MIFQGCSEIKHFSPVIEIESQGKLWDLHNAAEFRNLVYEVSHRKLIFNFKYFPNYDENYTINCAIQLLEVRSFKVSPRDPEMPFSEDDCLNEIIFDPKIEMINMSFWGGMKVEAICSVFNFENRENRGQAPI